MSTEIKTLEQCYEELSKDKITLQSKYNFSYKGKIKYTTLGRIWFNLLLPKNYPEFVDAPVNKGDLEKITFKIFEMNSPEDAAIIIDKIQYEAFKLATLNPVTFSKNSFTIPKKINESKKKLINDDTKLEEYQDIKMKLANEFLDSNSDTGLKDLIKSKTSGKLNADALAIWTISKGPVMDLENKISKPIQSALIDGYTGEEYYIAASEARRGYYIRGVGTSDPGTLARHIVFALSNLKISSTDCKSKLYLTLFVKESIFKLIQGRWYLNEKTNKLEQITPKSNIINKIIKLRSPLYCKDKNGICETCFGKNKSQLGTDKIGLLAGSVMNANGVQGFAMKARHAATTVNLKKCDFTKDIIYI